MQVRLINQHNEPEYIGILENYKLKFQYEYHRQIE
jgi:hypothetical protein